VHTPFAAITEPRRAEIVKSVWFGERSAGDIAKRLPVTFGAVSQHLKVLLDAGALRVRVDGRRRFYIADHDAFGPMAGALEEMWFGKLGRLKALAEAEQRRLDGAPVPSHTRRSRQTSLKMGRVGQTRVLSKKTKPTKPKRSPR
jgi:DNA-binding transcriptional ArsR family regulator